MAIKLIVFKEDYRCVIADVEEVVGADLGEPDCQLTKPYEFLEMDGVDTWTASKNKDPE